MGSSKSMMLKEAVADMDSVRKFIGSEYDINLQDDFGYTALMFACLNSCSIGSIGVVKELLSAGADPNLRDKNGWTVMMYIALRSDSYETTSEYVIEVIRTLISAGADPNLQNKMGYNAFMVSLHKRNIIIAESLLSLGTNPDLQDNLGLTALMLLSQNIDDERTKTLVEMLISAGATLDIQDPYEHKTALMRFAVNGRSISCTEEIITMLILAGARLDLTSHDGWTGRQLVEVYFPTVASLFGIGNPILPPTSPPPAPPPGKLFISRECLVCTDTPPELSLEPCGHIAVCRDCYSRFREQVCPLCRGAITSTRQVVFS